MYYNLMLMVCYEVMPKVSSQVMPKVCYQAMPKVNYDAISTQLSSHVQGAQQNISAIAAIWLCRRSAIRSCPKSAIRSYPRSAWAAFRTCPISFNRFCPMHVQYLYSTVGTWWSRVWQSGWPVQDGELLPEEVPAPEVKTTPQKPPKKTSKVRDQRRVFTQKIIFVQEIGVSFIKS